MIMTKEKVEQLELDVAVIKTSMVALKEDTKSVKGLLKWFIVLCSGVIILVTGTIINSSGDTRIMKEVLIHNSNVIGDIVSQGVEAGWYKPSPETYRTGNKTKMNK